MIHFVSIMLGLLRFDWIQYSFSYFFTTKIWLLLIIAVLGATVFAIPQVRNLPARLAGNKAWFVVQELGLLLLMVLSVFFMVNSTYSPFIYFRY